MFGTHSIKNGATEALRANGADSETRRQLGDWMSPQVALSYLQLSPGAQFSLKRDELEPDTFRLNQILESTNELKSTSKVDHIPQISTLW